jgi:hypothetical protein
MQCLNSLGYFRCYLWLVKSLQKNGPAIAPTAIDQGAGRGA